VRRLSRREGPFALSRDYAAHTAARLEMLIIRRPLRIGLRYAAGQEPAISRLARISRPGRRVYVAHSEIHAVLGGLGHSILTTSLGVMTGKRARKAGVGGEVLLEVW